MAQTSKTYNMYSALLAFVGWEGWAYFVNSAQGTRSGLISGLTQGIASFIFTFIMIFLLTKIYNLFPENFLRIIIPPLLTVGSIGGCITIVHIAVGTPRIFSTISPSLSVGFLFCVLTTWKLSRKI